MRKHLFWFFTWLLGFHLWHPVMHTVLSQCTVTQTKLVLIEYKTLLVFLTYSSHYSTLYESSQHLHDNISLSPSKVPCFSAGGVCLRSSLLFSQLPLLDKALWAGPWHLSSVYGMVRSSFGLMWGHSTACRHIWKNKPLICFYLNWLNPT